MSNSFATIVSKILLIEEDQVVANLSMDEVEDWDSMTHLVLISDLEKEYQIQFTDDEVVEIQSIGEIMQLLREKGAKI